MRRQRGFALSALTDRGARPFPFCLVLFRMGGDVSRQGRVPHASGPGMSSGSGTARAALRARVDPSDVVQEAQMEVVRRMDDYLKRRPMPFRLWLCKTAKERLLNLRRDQA